jgi:hypothetical protein
MDLDEEQGSIDFEPSKWIQRGLKYEMVPFHVINAHLLHALNIPKTAPPLPDPNVPITEFLCLTLPVQSTYIITSKPDQWFSKEPPEEDVSILLTRPNGPIPNMEFLAQLKAAAGQAWLDGAASVVDKRFGSDRQDKLPLWVITYWIKLAAVIGTQADWRTAKQWIEDNSRGPNFPFKPLGNLFGLLGWESARWRAPAPGGHEGVVASMSATSLAGNAANAAMVASSVAKKAHRRDFRGIM